MSAGTARTTSGTPLGGLARGGALNLVGAVVSAFTNLLLAVAVTRSLTTDGAGVFFSVTSFFLILVGAARLGSGTGLVYFVARQLALGRRELVGQTLRVALVPVVVFSAVLAVVLVIAANPLAALVVDHDTGAAATTIRISALFLPFAALLEGVLGAGRGFGTMRPTVLIEKVLRPIAQVVVVLLVAGGGTAAVVVAWCFPYVPAVMAGGVWLLVLLRRALRRARSEAHPADRGARVQAAESAEATESSEPGGTSHGLRRDYWRFTVPRAISGLIQVALQRLDVIIVAALVGAAQSAVYVASTRLLVVGAFGIQAISMAIQPHVASHYVREDIPTVRHLYRTATTWLVLMTWPLYLTGIVFAPTILLLFGPRYASGADVLVILAFATLLSTACGVVDVMLNMAGKSSWILFNVSIALVVDVALNFWLVPKLGIEGAAWAWMAAIAVNNLLPLTQLFVSSRIHPFGRSLLASGVLTVLAYLPLLWGARLLLGQGVPALVLGVLTGTVAYLVLLWQFRQLLALDELVSSLFRRRGSTAPQR